MYGITQVPLNLHALLEELRNEIRIVPYSRLTERYGLTQKEVFVYLKSELGTTHHRPERAQYVIYYNDALPEGTWRFTIAHELGHIFLEHFTVAGTDLLDEESIPQELYLELEREANAFARNLLSPAPTALRVARKNPGRETEAIAVAFFLSESAAEVRFDLIKTDSRYLTKEMRELYGSFTVIPPDYICTTCGNRFPMEDPYCVFCGGYSKKMGYAYAQLPEEGEPLQRCLRCGTRKLDAVSAFCHHCGAPLENRCPEGHRNPRYARFCRECGEPLLFGEIKEPAPEREDTCELPYYEETWAAAVCPCCGTENDDMMADYCAYCGNLLLNYCAADDHENPPHARYCHTCGRKTAYFALGIRPRKPALSPVVAWMSRIEVKRDGFCPLCGNPVSKRSKVCRNCRCPLENGCPECNEPRAANARYCSRCGGPTLYTGWYLFEEATQRELDALRPEPEEPSFDEMLELFAPGDREN